MTEGARARSPRGRRLARALFVAAVLSLPGANASTLAAASTDEVGEIHAAGVALYEQGEYRRALAKFEEALRLSPGEQVIRVNLGRTCVALASKILDDPRTANARALEHAGQLLQKALLHWEGDATTHELVALCALRRNRLAEAERALEEAVARAPDSARAWRQLGIVRDKRGKLAEAIAALERATAIDPTDSALAVRLRRLRHDRATITEGRPIGSARFRVFVPPEITLDHAREVLALLDATSEELERRWGGEPPQRVEVILYPPGEFSRRTGFAEEVGGAFDGRIRIAFPSELDAGGLDLEQVIRHETAHLILHGLPIPLPRWLDEGLAQWVDGGDRDHWAKGFVDQGGASGAVGLGERERSVDGSRGEISANAWAGLYQHSYLFLGHLVEKHGGFRLDLTVRRIRRGTAVEKAFEEVYGGTPVELDRAWRAALRAAPGSDETGGNEAGESESSGTFKSRGMGRR